MSNSMITYGKRFSVKFIDFPKVESSFEDMHRNTLRLVYDSLKPMESVMPNLYIDSGFTNGLPLNDMIVYYKYTPVFHTFSVVRGSQMKVRCGTFYDTSGICTMEDSPMQVYRICSVGPDSSAYKTIARTILANMPIGSSLDSQCYKFMTGITNRATYAAYLSVEKELGSNGWALKQKHILESCARMVNLEFDTNRLAAVTDMANRFWRELSLIRQLEKLDGEKSNSLVRPHVRIDPDGTGAAHVDGVFTRIDGDVEEWLGCNYPDLLSKVALLKVTNETYMEDVGVRMAVRTHSNLTQQFFRLL